jgi:hypothetical protein
MVRSALVASQLIAAAAAVRPFVNEPDTGLQDFLFSTNYTEGTLPPLRDMRGLPDFDYAARQVLDGQMYSFYRTAAAGEWSESRSHPLPWKRWAANQVNKATATTWKSGRRSNFVLTS